MITVARLGTKLLGSPTGSSEQRIVRTHSFLSNELRLSVQSNAAAEANARLTLIRFDDTAVCVLPTLVIGEWAPSTATGQATGHSRKR